MNTTACFGARMVTPTVAVMVGSTTEAIVIVAEPAATAVIVPLALTVAIAASLVVNVTPRLMPGSASMFTAIAWVSPGFMVTETGEGVMRAMPRPEFTVTVIVAIFVVSAFDLAVTMAVPAE